MKEKGHTQGALSTGCLKKKMPHKDMFDFFNPKNVTSGSGIDQT